MADGLLTVDGHRRAFVSAPPYPFEIEIGSVTQPWESERAFPIICRLGVEKLNQR